MVRSYKVVYTYMRSSKENNNDCMVYEVAIIIINFSCLLSYN